MSEWIIITLVLAGITLIIGLIVAFVIKKNGWKDKNKGPDYRVIYSVGFVFMPAGIALMISTGNPGLLGITALGIIYIAIGLANKDKWKKKR
jgi:hypothetical protein